MLVRGSRNQTESPEEACELWKAALNKSSNLEMQLIHGAPARAVTTYPFLVSRFMKWVLTRALHYGIPLIPLPYFPIHLLLTWVWSFQSVSSIWLAKNTKHWEVTHGCNANLCQRRQARSWPACIEWKTWPAVIYMPSIEGERELIIIHHKSSCWRQSFNLRFCLNLLNITISVSDDTRPKTVYHRHDPLRPVPLDYGIDSGRRWKIKHSVDIRHLCVTFVSPLLLHRTSKRWLMNTEFYFTNNIDLSIFMIIVLRCGFRFSLSAFLWQLWRDEHCCYN